MAYLSSFKSGKKRPFATTPLGYAYNFTVATPGSIKKVGTDIFQGITRSIGSVGQSVSKLLGSEEEELSYQDIKPGFRRELFKGIFGTEPIKALEDRIAESEVKIKSSPLAQSLGLDKHALPIAFGTIIGSTALDLTPFGGAEKNVVKTLVKETDVKVVSGILQRMKVPDELIPRFADLFAKATDNKTVTEGLDLLKGTLGIGKIGEQKAAKTPVEKLLTALDRAGTSRRDLEKAYTAERAFRAGGVEETFKQAGGQKGYFEALGQLKGELAPDKKTFKALDLGQEDVDSLFNQIQAHETLDVYEKVAASNGLQKMLAGEIPATSQLSYLEDVFGKEVVKEVLKKRPLLQKARDFFTNVINVPRSLVTSIDMSAPLRQGVFFTTTKPGVALDATGEMFRQAFSQKNFDAWLQELPNHPSYELMKQSNLYIANPNKLAGGLGAREEKFVSNLAEKIPLWGKVVKASERAYIGFLNKMRVDSFTQLSNKFIKDGIDPEENPEVFKALANFVNNATGRGDLGSFNRVAQDLNAIFFSPRLIASRFNLLNPVWYAKQPAPVRKEAIKSFAEFISVGTTVLVLAKMGGADVEIDPRSSDFGKIKVGDVRWDVWGGFQQWVRVFAQLASGQRKTSSGDVIELSKKQYPFESRKDVAERFLAGKLAPVPNLAYELLQGQKMFGEEITVPDELYENAVPLYLQDIGEAMEEIGPEAIFTVGIPGFFGVGVQSYKDRSRARGYLQSF